MAPSAGTFDSLLGALFGWSPPAEAKMHDAQNSGNSLGECARDSGYSVGTPRELHPPPPPQPEQEAPQCVDEHEGWRASIKADAMAVALTKLAVARQQRQAVSREIVAMRKMRERMIHAQAERRRAPRPEDTSKTSLHDLVSEMESLRQQDEHGTRELEMVTKGIQAAEEDLQAVDTRITKLATRVESLAHGAAAAEATEAGGWTDIMQQLEDLAFQGHDAELDWISGTTPLASVRTDGRSEGMGHVNGVGAAGVGAGKTEAVDAEVGVYVAAREGALSVTQQFAPLVHNLKQAGLGEESEEMADMLSAAKEALLQLVSARVPPQDRGGGRDTAAAAAAVERFWPSARMALVAIHDMEAGPVEDEEVDDNEAVGGESGGGGVGGVARVGGGEGNAMSKVILDLDALLARLEERGRCLGDADDGSRATAGTLPEPVHTPHASVLKAPVPVTEYSSRKEPRPECLSPMSASSGGDASVYSRGLFSPQPDVAPGALTWGTGSADEHDAMDECPPGEGVDGEAAKADRKGGSTARQLVPATQAGAAAEVGGVMEVTIISARHLPKMDLMGTCDGFCEVEWQGKQATTKVKKNTYSPDWDQTFDFAFRSAPLGDMVIHVKDWDRLTTP